MQVALIYDINTLSSAFAELFIVYVPIIIDIDNPFSILDN